MTLVCIWPGQRMAIAYCQETGQWLQFSFREGEGSFWIEPVDEGAAQRSVEHHPNTFYAANLQFADHDALIAFLHRDALFLEIHRKLWGMPPKEQYLT